MTAGSWRHRPAAMNCVTQGRHGGAVAELTSVTRVAFVASIISSSSSCTSARQLEQTINENVNCNMYYVQRVSPLLRFEIVDPPMNDDPVQPLLPPIARNSSSPSAAACAAPEHANVSFDTTRNSAHKCSSPPLFFGLFHNWHRLLTRPWNSFRLWTTASAPVAWTQPKPPTTARHHRGHHKQQPCWRCVAQILGRFWRT
jgi:hypothetical protein